MEGEIGVDVVEAQREKVPAPTVVKAAGGGKPVATITIDVFEDRRSLIRIVGRLRGSLVARLKAELTRAYLEWKKDTMRGRK